MMMARRNNNAKKQWDIKAQTHLSVCEGRQILDGIEVKRGLFLHQRHRPI